MQSLLNPEVRLTGAAARLLGGRETVGSALAMPPPAPPLRLRRQAIFAVEHPLGKQLRCIVGALWVTHDGDPKDILVTVGEIYRVDRCARMLVAALEDSELEITTATGDRSLHPDQRPKV